MGYAGFRLSTNCGRPIELRRSRERVVRLSHEAGVSAERERLAREIHDTLAQGLTSISSRPGEGTAIEVNVPVPVASVAGKEPVSD